jgi:hypothetical protein
MNYVKKELGNAVEVNASKRITVITTIDAESGAPVVLSVVEGEVSDDALSRISIDCGPITMNARTLEFVVVKETGRGAYVPIEDGPISDRDCLLGQIFNVGEKRLAKSGKKKDNDFLFNYSKSGKA